MKKMATVVTWQAPSGGRIDVTPPQEKRLKKAGIWPKNSIGEDYCEVHRGAHPGTPTYSDARIDAMIAERGR